MDKSEDLLDDLKQIYAQYQKEVPSKRKPWPESIRGRVEDLENSELNTEELDWLLRGITVNRQKFGPDALTKSKTDTIFESSNGADRA